MTQEMHEKPHRVLFDLSIAAEPGYGGIAQDTRLMFRALAQLKSVDLTGLLLGFRGHSISRIANRKYSKAKKHHEFGDAAEYLAYLSDGANSWKGSVSLIDAIEIALRRTVYFPSKHALRRFPELFAETLWRSIFTKSLLANDRNLICKKTFAYSSLTIQAIFDGIFSWGPRAKLDTRGYDFAIFEDARPVSVDRRTIKICRYHDAVPITQADTQSGPSWTKLHFLGVDLCREDSYWVCNSPGTKEELLSVFPVPDDRVFVIPCAIQRFESSLLDVPFPSGLIGQDNYEFGQVSSKNPRYILSVATLEPRKNFLGLIEAWERVVSSDDPQLKLVIVGSPGWRCDDILRVIKERKKTGNLIHLQNLSFAELQSLYKYAEAFAFPSFAEGFGMPPVEALACSTVPIVANTPNNHWVLGESAIYVNPYDVEDIANGIRRLTVRKDSRDIKEKMLRGKSEVLSRFSLDTIAAEWDKLLHTLRVRERLV